MFSKQLLENKNFWPLPCMAHSLVERCTPSVRQWQGPFICCARALEKQSEMEPRYSLEWWAEEQRQLLRWRPEQAFQKAIYPPFFFPYRDTERKPTYKKGSVYINMFSNFVICLGDGMRDHALSWWVSQAELRAEEGKAICAVAQHECQAERHKTYVRPPFLLGTSANHWGPLSLISPYCKSRRVNYIRNSQIWMAVIFVWLPIKRCSLETPRPF